MKPLACVAAAALTLFASPALAWGDLGHEVIASIAYGRLTPAVRAKVDALLASDRDMLSAPGFDGAATWADYYRIHHRETAAWHYVDIELDHPDLDAACFGHPKLAPGQPASEGPAKDCIVDKIEEFSAELHDPRTPQAERLLALKFLIHFVGDLHQPLHAADDHDRGGNCIGVSPPTNATNLHAFWDTTVLYGLGSNHYQIAARLSAKITRAEVAQWSRGDARTWVWESFQLAKRDAYALPDRPRCADARLIGLTSAYEARAERDAAVQLEKAGIRLAYLLNRSLS